MITILLADDHAIVRAGLRTLMEHERDLQVVGETGSGLDVERLVAELRPDLVVLDLVIPEVNGLEITRRLRAKYPATRVIILSMHAASAYVANAIANGANGYVLKGGAATEVLQAIRIVMAGARYLSPPFNDQSVEEYLAQASNTRLDLYEKLTAREREVFGLAAHGLKCFEIGLRLDISSRTVEVHRANAMRKLGLRTQAEMYRYALGRQIILGPLAPAHPGQGCQDKTCEECRQKLLESCHEVLASVQSADQVCQVSLGLDLPFHRAG